MRSAGAVVVPGPCPHLVASTRTVYGRWRSLVAHQTGGLGVAGSSPARPTTNKQGMSMSRRVTTPWGGVTRGELASPVSAE